MTDLLDELPWVALILAKSESTRLPNKNTLDFHGEPMFLTNVRKCVELFDKVYVSSDSQEILKMARNIGARGIRRPSSLCGNTPNIDVYRHAVGQMKGIQGIVAVQANSPTVPIKLISDIGEMTMMGYNEIMTCHPDRSLYGSVWAMTADRLANYGDPYKPTPEVLIVDKSIDIHTKEDLEQAFKQYNNEC